MSLVSCIYLYLYNFGKPKLQGRKPNVPLPKKIPATRFDRVSSEL